MKNSRVSNLAAWETRRHSEKLGSEEEELGGVGKRHGFGARHWGLSCYKDNQREGSRRTLKKGDWLFVVRWMDLESVIQSEVNQKRETNTIC